MDGKEVHDQATLASRLPYTGLRMPMDARCPSLSRVRSVSSLKHYKLVLPISGCSLLSASLPAGGMHSQPIDTHVFAHAADSAFQAVASVPLYIAEVVPPRYVEDHIVCFTSRVDLWFLEIVES